MTMLKRQPAKTIKGPKEVLAVASGTMHHRLQCRSPMNEHEFKKLPYNSQAIERLYATVAKDPSLTKKGLIGADVKDLLTAFLKHGEKFLIEHGQLPIGEMLNLKVKLAKVTVLLHFVSKPIY